MSGGVDSAVALLRAGRRRGRRHAPPLDRPERARHRARLLLAERRARRAARVPRARDPARHARPARGVPRGRRAAVHRRLRGRRHAEPVRALQRQLPLRRAARLRRPHRRRAARDRPLRAHRRARRPPPARARGRPAQGPELHARRASTRPRSTASGSRSASRRRTRRAPRPRPPASPPRTGPRARRRASSAATTTATSSAATALRRRPGAVVDEAGRELGTHDGFWRFTPGQRRGLGIAAAEPLYALGADAATNTVVAGPRASLARRTSRCAAACDARRAPRRGEAPLPLARAARVA